MLKIGVDSDRFSIATSCLFVTFISIKSKMIKDASIFTLKIDFNGHNQWFRKKVGKIRGTYRVLLARWFRVAIKETSATTRSLNGYQSTKNVPMSSFSSIIQGSVKNYFMLKCLKYTSLKMIGWSFWTHWCKLELEVLKFAEVICVWLEMGAASMFQKRA